MRHSRAILDQWNARFPLLYNYVHTDNALHRRWLKRVGFTEGATRLRGEGAEFITVTRTHVR